MLAWLLPTLTPDIVRFYEMTGPSMIEMFKSHQLQTLDKDLLLLVVQRLDAVHPGTTANLKRAAWRQPAMRSNRRR